MTLTTGTLKLKGTPVTGSTEISAIRTLVNDLKMKIFIIVYLYMLNV